MKPSNLNDLCVPANIARLCWWVPDGYVQGIPVRLVDYNSHGLVIFLETNGETMTLVRFGANLTPLPWNWTHDGVLRRPVTQGEIDAVIAHPPPG